MEDVVGNFELSDDDEDDQPFRPTEDVSVRGAGLHTDGRKMGRKKHGTNKSGDRVMSPLKKVRNSNFVTGYPAARVRKSKGKAKSRKR
jgi:hypothetical protein